MKSFIPEKPKSPNIKSIPPPRKGSTRRGTNISTRSRNNSVDDYNIDHHHHHTSEFNPKVNRLLHQNLGPLEVNPEKYASGNFKCSCRACAEKSPVKEQDLQQQLNSTCDFFYNYDFTKDADITNPEKDFVFVLKRLIPSKPIPYTLRLFIPETVVFINGDVKFIVLTEKSKKLKFIQDKESLTSGHIRKFFQELLKAKDEEIPVIAEEQQRDAKTKKLESNDSSEDSKNPLRAKSKNPKRSIVRAPLAGKILSPETGIIKYKDDTTTIFTEMEFTNILLKRKADNFWKNVQYMQLYLRVKSGISTLQRVYFVYDREKEDPLFERSRVEIRYLNKEIPKASENFIPLHEEERFEEELFKTNTTKFYLYLLMKIHHFIDIMWGTKIIKMGGDFIKDHLGVPWLINISRVQYEKDESLSDIGEEEKFVKEPEKEEDKQEEEEAEKFGSNAQRKYRIFKIVHKFISHQPEKNKEPNLEVSPSFCTFQSNVNEYQNKTFSPQLLLQSRKFSYYTPNGKNSIAKPERNTFSRESRRPHNPFFMNRGRSLAVVEDYVSKGLNFETDKVSKKYLNISSNQRSGRISTFRNESRANQSFYFSTTSTRPHSPFGTKSFLQTLADAKERSRSPKENTNRYRKAGDNRKDQFTKLEMVRNDNMKEKETSSSSIWTQNLKNIIKRSSKLKLNET